MDYRAYTLANTLNTHPNKQRHKEGRPCMLLHTTPGHGWRRGEIQREREGGRETYIHTQTHTHTHTHTYDMR